MCVVTSRVGMGGPQVLSGRGSETYVTWYIRFCLDGIVHSGRVAGMPDGVDRVIPLCEETIYKPRRLRSSCPPTDADVDCMSCLVEEARSYPELTIQRSFAWHIKRLSR